MGIADRHVTAVLWGDRAADRWAATVESFQVAGVRRVILAGCAERSADRAELGESVEALQARSLVEALRLIRRDPEDLFAVATSPVLVPLGVFDRALEFLEADRRVGCVCFWSNAAGPLSFPHRNRASADAGPGHDHATLTTRLRELTPDSGPVPIATAAGALTLVPAHVLDVVGPLVPGVRGDEHHDDGAYAVADLSLRMSRRGLRTVLDAGTFVERSLELGPYCEPTVDEPERARLSAAFPWFPAVHDLEAEDPDSPLGLAFAAALVKVRGLRVVIDGTALGPNQMGTQVQATALATALADHPEVNSVVIGLPADGTVPAYAAELFARDNVEGIPIPGLRFPAHVHGDVLLRPKQPTDDIPWPNWRNVAPRVVTTLLDLIAFSNGAYHVTSAHWLRHRAALRDSLARVDGVTVISDDVAAAVDQFALDVPGDRLRTVHLGTDHLDVDTHAEMPDEFEQRVPAGEPFLLVLGASYAHKNRDLAVRAWHLLRDRGYPHVLVLAGFPTAHGSSATDEISAGAGRPEPVVLAEVSSAERTWLLRHADVVLYPSSAEGFGLVPFEAATLGTPVVAVAFGPLAEVLPDLPVVADSWEPEALAAAVTLLIDAPDLAAEQIEAVRKHGQDLTWDAAAERHVQFYRELISRPRRGSGRRQKLAAAGAATPATEPPRVGHGRRITRVLGKAKTKGSDA